MIGVGDLVVCVDDYFWDEDWMAKTPNRPVRGLIYTVRKVVKARKTVGLYLEEIVNEPRSYGDGAAYGEGGFIARRFRPVKRTDISIFRQIVENVPRQNVTA